MTTLANIHVEKLGEITPKKPNDGKAASTCVRSIAIPMADLHDAHWVMS
jgi:hypothetical protein